MLQGGLPRSIRSVAASTTKKKSKEGLKKWFGQNKGKGWVDCKTGKSCGRKSAKGDTKRAYPACRPTMAQCKSASAKKAVKKKTSSKRVNWKKNK